MFTHTFSRHLYSSPCSPMIYMWTGAGYQYFSISHPLPWILAPGDPLETPPPPLPALLIFFLSFL